MHGKVAGWMPGQGTSLGCMLDASWGVQEAADADGCLTFIFLSLSLPLSISLSEEQMLQLLISFFWFATSDGFVTKEFFRHTHPEMRVVSFKTVLHGPSGRKRKVRNQPCNIFGLKKPKPFHSYQELPCLQHIHNFFLKLM